MNAWQNGLQYKSLLMENGLVTSYLNENEINEAFEIDYFLRNVDTIYKRVGINE